MREPSTCVAGVPRARPADRPQSMGPVPGWPGWVLGAGADIMFSHARVFYTCINLSTIHWSTVNPISSGHPPPCSHPTLSGAVRGFRPRGRADPKAPHPTPPKRTFSHQTNSHARWVDVAPPPPPLRNRPSAHGLNRTPRTTAGIAD